MLVSIQPAHRARALVVSEHAIETTALNAPPRKTLAYLIPVTCHLFPDQ
jgi:hypothetical protein